MQGKGAPEAAVCALQDTIASFGILAFELLFTAHDQRIALHFDVEIILVHARHFEPHHDPLVVFEQIAAQHCPAARR